MDTLEIEATIRAISARLVTLEDEIRAAQPVRSGAVLMHLYWHKKQGLCLGCPHPIWKQWRGHPYHPVRQWQAHPIDNPLARIRRNQKLSALAKEAIAITDLRTDLIQALKTMRRVERKCSALNIAQLLPSLLNGSSKVFP